MDATGLSFRKYAGPWSLATYPSRYSSYQWLKLHALIDDATNTILAYSVTDPHVHDTVEFPGLLRHWGGRIRELYADAGYFSHANCWAVRVAGGTPYIRTKVTTKRAPPPDARGRHANAFDAMVWAYQNDPAAWKRTYGRRNRVESIFSALKRRLGDRFSAIAKAMMRIEAALKVLVWNLTCVRPGEFQD